MDINTAIINYNHYLNPALKQDNAWAVRVMQDYYLYGGATNLLADKNPAEIRAYAAGKQSVNKYKKMFRRLGKEIDRQAAAGTGGTAPKDLTGIDWQPLGFLSQPLNAAISILQKTPIYLKCTAIDGLAQDKKKEDYELLKNRPFHDAALQEYAGKIQTPLESPKTKNNSENVDIANFDLDPTKEDELNFFFSMFHKLRPESAFETALMAIANVQELKKIRDIEARDQFYYGVSCDQSFFSTVTGLPKLLYIYPGNVYTPPSDLPDFADCTHRYLTQHMNSEMIMDAFGDELDTDSMIALFDAYLASKGYTQRWNTMDAGQRRKQTIEVVYMEFKSWDAQKFHKKKSRTTGLMINEMVDYDYELRYSRRHPDRSLRGKPKEATDDEYINKKVYQSTYCGWFFPCLIKKVFKYKKLEGSQREPGRESLSPFSINIWKSQEKGAAELCIPVIDDIQRAYYKMQHCIIMSKPRGAFVDLRYMRQAVQNLAATDLKMSMKDLMNNYVDNNIFLGDSEGIDPMEMQSGARPFYDIPGGVGSEVGGYLEAIRDGVQNVAKLTGINDAITGQAPNPDALVGVQKLMLQSSINSLYYAQNGMKNQTEKVFKTWAHQVQYILKNEGTASYNAIEAIIGSYKVDVIKDLKTIPLHQFGILVENAPTEREQEELNNILMQAFSTERINASDYVTLKRIFNYKDAQQLLAIRERKTQDRIQQSQMQQIQSTQAIEQMRNSTKVQVASTTGQAGMQETLIKGNIEKWLAQFNAQLLQMQQQVEGVQKDYLQDKRIHGQIEKAAQSANISAQKPLPA